MKTLTLAFLSVLVYGQALGKVIYVSELASGLKTGDSWQNAFSNLSDAINASKAGDSIWITEGFYTPEKSVDKVFKLKDGVSLFGRFAGNEKSINDRFSATATILTTEFTSYRYQHKGDMVAEITDHINNIVLDDITFSYGKKNGVKIENASPTFVNCSFEGNGDRNDSTSTGAVFIRGEQKLTRPVFKNCQFYYNEGFHGGGVKVLGSKAFPYFENCFFSSNSSGSGAAIWANGANTKTIGCLFNKNISDTAGCCHILQGRMESINCTYVQNTARFASVCLAQSNGFIQFVNAIIWGNGTGTSMLETKKSLDTIKARYSIIEGGYNGKAILNQNPQFPSKNSFKIERTSPAFNAGDPKLKLTQLPRTDLVRNKRVRHGHIDIGAYEVECELVEHSEWTRISVKSCGAYTAPSGAIIHTSGHHFDIIPNRVGCDSIIVINLEILSPSYHQIEAKGCSAVSVNGVKYYSSGTHQQILKNASGCDSILTVKVSIPQLNSDVEQTGNTLTALAKNAQYQWIDCFKNNAPIQGETKRTFTSQKDGSYAVIITKDDCNETSRCFNLKPSGIQTEQPLETAIFPNPVGDKLIVRRNTSTLESYHIVTLSGISVSMGTLHREQNQIDVSMLPKGIYLLKIGDETARIVKM